MASPETNAEILSDFGLTLNQAKVYVTVAKLGLASISQVSKSSKVRREDVYRMLPRLQELGLIEKILGKPAKIRATPAEDGLSILIRREKELASKRLSELEAKKSKFLRSFEAYQVKPVEKEGPQFSLVSQREPIVKRGLAMIKKAQSTIDVVVSRHEFYHLFAEYTKPVRKAIRKGVRVRVILDASAQYDSILRTIEEYKSSVATFNLRYSYQPSSHFMTVDNKQALVATSGEPPIGHSPYLWTDNINIVKLMQKYFEDLWHVSANQTAIVTKGAPEMALQFVNELRPTNHAVLVYESAEVKHNVLFNYIKTGLENGEATAYVATEEDPSQIRDGMRQFGIEVEENERTGALRILGFKDFYIIDGKFDPEITFGLIKRMYNEALQKGFNGWRITGEMACFFKRNLVHELIEYERGLHRVFDMPVIGICAYNAEMLGEVGNPINLYSELVSTHGTVLFTGIDNELGRIEIRKA
ncbi:MAG: MEDS domain-containing protein [Nitrososphaeria archaeon]